jgi:hypothetical protein
MEIKQKTHVVVAVVVAVEAGAASVVAVVV